MFKYLRYRYAKTKMVAYINGELAPHTRRFVGRLINDDARVYREYILQRQTKQQLEHDLPIFGRPDAGQLNAVWANIQAEMSKPVSQQVPALGQRPRYGLSYGVALAMFILAVLLPFAFDASHANTAASQSSVPETVEFTTPDTQKPNAQPTSVALVVQLETQATDDVASEIQNTPAPHTPGQ
jgi:anti-sigma factor RsiW